MLPYNYFLNIIIVCLLISRSFQANFYSESDIIKLFKNKFNKVYKNINEENQAPNNLIKNFVLLEERNEKNADKNIVFVLNRLADLDTKQLERQYSVTISPFENLRSNSFRGSNKNIIVDEGELYDLDNAKDFYKSFLKQYNKNYTKKHERRVHYYKFVQTLVKINEQRLQGINATVDENADILEEPYEYFY